MTKPVVPNLGPQASTFVVFDQTRPRGSHSSAACSLRWPFKRVFDYKFPTESLAIPSFSSHTSSQTETIFPLHLNLFDPYGPCGTLQTRLLQRRLSLCDTSLEGLSVVGRLEEV